MKINKNIANSSIPLKGSELFNGISSYWQAGLCNNFILLFVLIISAISSVNAQEDKEKLKVLQQSQELLSEASFEMKNDNFPLAEAEYRKAISLNPKEDTGKYNLGTAYYNKEMNATAMNRFKQATAVADTKTDKHKAFHNLGNTYMNEKKYQEAVESYKSALRNNPKDDETRYNLALAKEMLEDQQKDGGGDDKEDKEDKKDEEKEQENENNKKDGEDGDEKDEKDKGEEEEDKKEGEDNEDKGKPDEPKEEKENKQPPPVPGQLSPQQVKNLLEAMNNEEKKVQDKINAEKQKGAKVKAEKDW